MVSLSTGDGDLGAVPRVTLVATQAPHGRVSNSSRDDDIECPCGSAVHVIPEVQTPGVRLGQARAHQSGYVAGPPRGTGLDVRVVTYNSCL